MASGVRDGTPRARRWVGILAPIAVASMALVMPVPAAAQLRGSLHDDASRAPEAGYRVKAVAGAPAAPGVRRVIEVFGGWTLICDAERRRRICNAAQSIAAADGSLAFSWSLAATKGGEPVFLIRAPVTDFPAHTVSLDFGAGETLIRLSACDAQVCLGFLPLDPGIVRRIRERGGVTVRYRAREGAAPVTLVTSLDGLGAAAGSIK